MDGLVAKILQIRRWKYKEIKQKEHQITIEFKNGKIKQADRGTGIILTKGKDFFGRLLIFASKI